MLWETMIFGGKFHNDMMRHTSRESAMTGHLIMVKKIREESRWWIDPYYCFPQWYQEWKSYRYLRQQSQNPTTPPNLLEQMASDVKADLRSIVRTVRQLLQALP